MPQGIHKPARRSEKASKSHQQGSSTASSSRRAPRMICPALLSQAERTTIESWQENVSEKTIRLDSEGQKQEAAIQAYLAAKLKLFEMSLAKEKSVLTHSDTASSTSSRS